MRNVKFLMLVPFACQEVRAWRRWSEVSRGGYRSSTSSPVVDEAPTLTEKVDHDHVIEEFHLEGDFSFDQTVDMPNHLDSFLRTNRNLLLKGGGNPISLVERTPDLMREWRDQSRVVGSELPHHDDEIVAIESTVPIVPGLKISATSIVGCRLIKHSAKMTYEFTLIRDNYHPEGRRPLLWFYHKMTGDEKGSNDGRSTHGLCRVTFQPSNDNKLQISYLNTVRVACQLPRRLRRLLSQNTIEHKIKASMAKQLKKEVLQSAKKIEEALEEWR